MARILAFGCPSAEILRGLRVWGRREGHRIAASCSTNDTLAPEQCLLRGDFDAVVMFERVGVGDPLYQNKILMLDSSGRPGIHRTIGASSTPVAIVSDAVAELGSKLQNI